LFATINKYAYSAKEQQIAAKKIYGIDTGLLKSVGFAFSENKGRLLENAVFLRLRRNQQKIFYYKTTEDYEVDFFLPEQKTFVQAVWQLNSPATLERELRALSAAVREQPQVKSCVIVTENIKQTYRRDKLHIQVVPLYEWLL
jgi:predicted AAA+ superfamily ATPase